MADTDTSIGDDVATCSAPSCDGSGDASGGIVTHSSQHDDLVSAVETWEAALGAPLGGFARFVVKDGMEFGSNRVWWESASHPRRSEDDDDAHDQQEGGGVTTSLSAIGDSLMTTASVGERDTGARSSATDNRSRERRSPHEGTDYAVYSTTGALLQSMPFNCSLLGRASVSH